MSARRLGLAALIAAAAAILATSLATAEIAQKGNVRIAVEGRLAPKKLPREGIAPVAVTVGWDATTVEGGEAPKLKSLQIEVNRHGRFDSTGLPVCPLAKIQPASSSRALANCRSSLVGEGKFSAQVVLGNQEPYEAGGRLLVFNGEKGGKPVLFGQIYSAHPFATSFVIVFSLNQRKGGTFGTVMSAKIPKALLSWGSLTGIEMTLSRRFGFEGSRHSYVSANCPAPKGFGVVVFPLARTSFSFAGGTSLSTTLTDTCKVRG